MFNSQKKERKQNSHQKQTTQRNDKKLIMWGQNKDKQIEALVQKRNRQISNQILTCNDITQSQTDSPYSKRQPVQNYNWGILK